MESLTAAASADGHTVIAPTYIIQKEAQIIGYLGIVPSVLVWLDSQKAHIRDSIVAMNFWENMIRNTTNSQVIGVPCTNNSPLRPFLPRAGYIPTESTIFLKAL